MAAPIGNQNAARPREWRDQIIYALENYEGGKIQRGQALRAIAMQLVEDAIGGDKSAREEIANRLDGKPVQATEITGQDGGPVQAKVTIEFVNGN